MNRDTINDYIVPKVEGRIESMIFSAVFYAGLAYIYIHTGPLLASPIIPYLGIALVGLYVIFRIIPFSIGNLWTLRGIRNKTIALKKTLSNHPKFKMTVHLPRALQTRIFQGIKTENAYNAAIIKKIDSINNKLRHITGKSQQSYTLIAAIEIALESILDAQKKSTAYPFITTANTQTMLKQIRKPATRNLWRAPELEKIFEKTKPVSFCERTAAKNHLAILTTVELVLNNTQNADNLHIPKTADQLQNSDSITTVTPSKSRRNSPALENSNEHEFDIDKYLGRELDGDKYLKPYTHE